MIGSKFITIRKTFGLNQEQFARILDVSNAAISKIESGQTKHPRGLLFQKLSREFNINLNWLYLDGQEMFIRGKRPPGFG